jgi:hypothetical protein
MRFIALTIAVAVSLVAPYALPAAPGITVPSVTVGRNLQMSGTVMLAQPAAEGGVTVTLTSDDPSRLLLSEAQDKAGSAKISITVRPRFKSYEFYLHGLADSGTVTYTASAVGIGGAQGTVTLAPSAIVILGPFKAPKFPTTPRGQPSKITIVSAALGSSLMEQEVAGGSKVDVTIASSNPNAGTLQASKLTLGGGSSTAATYFLPAAEGDTTLSPVQPPGFTAAPKLATVIASVARPGIGILGDIFLGKDLQQGGRVLLSEGAPPGGLKVTLTSADGSKLLLSTQEDQPGAASITIAVPEGKQQSAEYYVQAIGDSGNVTYDAVAPGFRSRTATIGLTRSGIIVAYGPYGPPEEAKVLLKKAITDDRRFSVSLADAKEHPTAIVVWSAYLDRDSGRAADITVQSVRGGVSATVVLTSSDPTVGTVESPLTIKSTKAVASGRFTPLRKGTTVISIDTPAGFARPKNATSVPVIVNE